MPLSLKDIFTTYRILGWQLFSFIFFNTSFHCLLAFTDSICKSQLSIVLLFCRSYSVLGFVKFSVSIFIKFGKFTLIIPSSLLMPHKMPLRCPMDLKLTIFKIKLQVFSPNLLFSKSAQLSKKHNIYPIALNIYLKVLLSSSLSFTLPSNPSTHLLKCTLPQSLSQLPMITSIHTTSLLCRLLVQKSPYWTLQSILHT